jgi:hypothetical protein
MVPERDVSLEVLSVTAQPNRHHFDSHIEVWSASVLSCSLHKSLSRRFMASLPGAVTALNQLWSQNVVQTDTGIF